VSVAARDADVAAQRDAERLEDEALALSGALPDDLLAAVVEVVSRGMAGPLARSPLALSRAAVTWCRAAADRRPGPLADAVTAGLASGLTVGEAAPALTLPAAGTGTPPHRPPPRHRRGRVAMVMRLPDDSSPAPERRGGGRVPPHNVEAEESLLGAMLLSKDAVATAVENVSAADFYQPAHAHLFEAIVALYGAGESRRTKGWPRSSWRNIATAPRPRSDWRSSST
jgi:hypothetical protein